MTTLETMVSLLNSISGSPVVTAYEIPSTVKNAIIWKLISTVPINSMSGSLVEKLHIEVDCFGDTLSKSISLADKVKAKLDLNNTNFHIGFLTNRFITKDIELGLFESILEFHIW